MVQTMSLKRNISANYLSQGYSTVVGIAVLPFYLRSMGAEAYGLIGFFAMLQAWFGLLDLGLTPTIGRETARYRAGAMPAAEYRSLFRVLTLTFVAVAIVGGTTLLLLSGYISHRWLSPKSLPQADVILAIQSMAISAALRWMSGLYRGVIVGSERMVWLSSFNSAVATLRFIAPLGTMAFFGYAPVPFFLHQLLVAVAELAGLAMMARTLLPQSSMLSLAVSLAPIRRVLRFSLTIAFTSSVWIVVTQSDKLLLSGVLPLDEYGYFSLAVLVANGILIVAAPISGPLMPRMAKLYAQQDYEQLLVLYRRATRWVTATAGAVAVTVAVQAEPLLFAWTGDLLIAQKAAAILRLYAIGNGILAVSAFPYYLQYALGNLRYHFIGNALIAATLVPAVFIAASRFGAIGAGSIWLAVNAAYFLLWIGFVHERLIPGLHRIWLTRDVAAPCAAALIAGVVMHLYRPAVEGRLGNLVLVGGAGAFALLMSMLSIHLTSAGNISKIIRKVDGSATLKIASIGRQNEPTR
jgi:O-antigen/teichoic acid export membrane protein